MIDAPHRLISMTVATFNYYWSVCGRAGRANIHRVQACIRKGLESVSIFGC
jgi:hypothetical protein